MKKKIIFYVINFIMITNIFSLEKLQINDAGWLDYGYNEALVKDVKSFNDILSLYSEDELKQIKILDITNTKISKIEGLEKLINLERLNISINKIEKIEGLDKLVNLKELNLSTNKISKIEKLDKLIQLTKLNLGENNISKIESLDKLTNLFSLDLCCNNISKIENLEKLSKLRELALDRNKIEILENFNFWEKINNNLTHLMIWDNPLKHIDKKTFDLFEKLNMFKKRKYKIIESKIQLKSNYGVNSSNIKNISKNDILFEVPGTSTYTHKDNIQNKKGNWIQVITKDFIIGWCFDAYLEKVKDEEVKKN